MAGVFGDALGLRAMEDRGPTMKPEGLPGGEGTAPLWESETLGSGHQPAPWASVSSLLMGDAGWPDPAHELPLASSAQIPEVGSHRLLDGARALYFPRIQEGDSGLYSCRAENQAGTAQRDFDLLVLSE